MSYSSQLLICLTLRCPARGQGAARKPYDLSQIRESLKAGKRTEEWADAEPKCQEDFVKWWTEEVPSFIRSLAVQFHMTTRNAQIQNTSTIWYTCIPIQDCLGKQLRESGTRTFRTSMSGRTKRMLPIDKAMMLDWLRPKILTCHFIVLVG